jgi:hypothetical protein
VQPGATADYENGTLVGVTATATNGADTLQFADGTVYMNGQDYANVAYDAADSDIAFQLPDGPNGTPGTVGAISYTVPWDQVDTTQASQSLTPTAFNLNVAGQNFNYGSANYTQAPALLFAYGEFVGVTFALTPPVGFTYGSITGSFDGNGNNIITATQAGTGTQFIAAAEKRLAAQNVQFSTYTSPASAINLTVTVTLSDKTDVQEVIGIPANAQPATVATLVYSVLKDDGLDVTLNGTNLLIKGKNQNSQVTKVEFDVLNPPAGWTGPSNGGHISTTKIVPELWMNGKEAK